MPASDAITRKISQDPFAKWMGMELEELTPGHARVAMTLTPAKLNFHGIPHGGAIFSLADAAFAAASNSHGQPAVALSMTIHYLAAAEPEPAWSPRPESCARATGRRSTRSQSGRKAER